MSGIVAALRLDDDAAVPELARRMLAAIAWRGDDSSGCWADGPVVLAAGLRPTTTESLDESQPLVGPESAVAAVFDGYLSNAKDLRAALGGRGAADRTSTDCALVLAAYRAWGERFVERLDGEFALVVWDARERVLVAARDPTGLRPLCYAIDGATLLIGSDPLAILAGLRTAPRLDEGYLLQVLVGEMLDERDTAWSGIRRLGAAHTLIARRGQIAESRYWIPDPTFRIAHRSDADYRAEYRAMFADCARRAMRSAGTLSFQVSGGLDSSALFAMADALSREGALPAPALAGYTLATPAGSAADEDDYVRALEAKVGRAVRRVPMTLPPIERFAQFAREDADAPLFPNNVMLDDLLAQAASDGSRVMVNGLGGDNWLDGSPTYYREELAARHWAELTSLLREDARSLGPKAAASLFLRTGVAALLPEAVQDRARAAWRALRGRSGRDAWPAWLTPRALDLLQDRDDSRRRFLAQWPVSDRYKIAKLTSPDFQMFLRLVDRRFARFGLESRTPMFSRTFIEFAMATPERLRVAGGVTKSIHRAALGDLLPAAITQRTDKAEFSVVHEGLRTAYAAIAEGPVPAALTPLVAEKTFREAFRTAASSVDTLPYFSLWAQVSAYILAGLEKAGPTLE